MAHDAERVHEDANGEIRNEDGLLIDEYSDESLAEERGLDALDVPDALVSDAVLDEVPSEGDGTGTVDLPLDLYVHGHAMAASEERRFDSDQMDSNEIEPHSADELNATTIGKELRGVGGVTRDGEVHGERLMDSPDK